jgi:hypothetical protein
MGRAAVHARVACLRIQAGSAALGMTARALDVLERWRMRTRDTGHVKEHSTVGLVLMSEHSRRYLGT